jgi:hypothetical protein
MGMIDRRRSLRGVASLAAAWAAAGCAIRVGKGDPNGQGSASGADREAPRIDVDAAYAAVQAGRAVLVDVRGAESYRASRAAGALLLPLEDIERAPAAAIARLPTGKQPIFYCT